MRYFNEKIAYLRGVCHGSGFDETTKEGKIFDGILDVLDDMADIISALDENDYTSDDDESNGNDKDDTEDIQYSYVFICPHCNQEVSLTDEMLDEEQEIICPHCGNKFK